MATTPPPASPVSFPHPGPPPERPERPEGLPEPSPRWAPWTAPVSLIAGFAVALFGYVIIGGIGSATGARVDAPAVTILGTLVQDGALIGSALVFANLAGRPRPGQFGLRPTRLWSGVGWLLLTWFAFVVFSAVWVTALGIEERDDLPDQLGADESTVALVAVAVLVCVVAPVAEEFFFRGYFFTALRNWKGAWAAASMPGPLRRATSFPSPPSASGCACSTGGPARCTPASRCTPSTIRWLSGLRRAGTGKFRW
jgi:membrane protease YdiL (CAAX protease family)